MATEYTGKGLLVKAESIADEFRDEVKTSLARCPRPPRLVGILGTSSSPSKYYADFTKKQCDAIGVDFILKLTGAAANPELGEGDGVEEAIIEANEDADIDGIMVYYPIFGGQQDHYLQQILSPFKDVEGLHFKFHYNLYHNIRFIEPQSLSSSSSHQGALPLILNDQPPPGMAKSIIPCTPLAVIKCLEYLGVYNKVLPYGDRAYGRTVTVINRSEVVGRPLAALLANDGARVFSVDIDSIQEYTKRPHAPAPEPGAEPNTSGGPTSNTAGAKTRRFHPRHIVHTSALTLQQCLAISDVVVSAVPSQNYKVKTEWLKDGCLCVNVSADKNFEKDVREKASMYLPAVGKVTILMLLRNLLRLQQYKEISPPDVAASQ